MLIRREEHGDVVGIREVHAAAFAAEGEPMEVRLVDALRESDAWILRCRGWRARRSRRRPRRVHARVRRRGRRRRARAARVLPATQHQGVGTALMHAVIGAADVLDEPLIALLGAPGYYGRFGFVAGTSRSIEPPEPAWGEHFQVRTLSAFEPSIVGAFSFASPFTTVT
jgi:putative acetyltransferase